MTIKTRLLIVVLLLGMLPIGVMIIAGKQVGLGMNQAFYNTMAIVLMVSILVGLVSPGIIKQWLFSNQVQKMKEFCQHIKAGRYDVVLTVPNERDNDGNENELVDLMRDMNWMVHRIKVNELELRQVVVDLEQSRTEIQSRKKVLEEVNAAQLVVQSQLQGRTQELKEALDKLRNLLDNIGQGFLSFGKDLRVAGEYSAECVMIFNQEIKHELVSALLYPEDPEQQEFLTALFDKVFQEEDVLLRENYLSLLPEEIELAGSLIQITYKLIHYPFDPAHKEIVLILTDITQKCAMEKRIEEEKDRLSMVVRAVTHQQEFAKAKRDYEVFCRQELPELLTSHGTELTKIGEIFRTIHTWKGTFAQLGLLRVAAKLHELETDLAEVRNEIENDRMNTTVRECFVDYSPETLYEWLEQEVEELRKVLGSQFLLRDATIVVENCKLQELEEKIRRLLTPCQAGPLIEDLRRLRYKPFSELINMVPEYIADLALNQGKEISSLLITGTKTLVDPIKYHDFAKALVHVFRNAIAHGLETPEERVQNGKQPQGQIKCNIEEYGANMVIAIADDGKGIDVNRIRELAVAKGICSELVVAALSEKEIVQLIFADGLSSVAATNELAGRGVGLAAVKQELEKLGGHIEIKTVVGKGTKFTFILPLVDSDYRLNTKEVEPDNGACVSCG